MSDSNDDHALELISNEVDESQIKIILSSQCIKAQVFLTNKLRQRSEQRKGTCNFIKSGNLKLETEIKNADQKVISAITALEVIKSANIELKKELLLSRNRKLEIIDRVNTGIKKYEGIWEKSKTKYENIPFVKNFLQTKNESLTLRENINILNEGSQKILIELKKKKVEIESLDRKRILEVAEYFVNEKPKTLRAINDKTVKIKELNKDIKVLKTNRSDNISNKSQNNVSQNKEFNNKIHERMNVMENSWLNLSNSNDEIGLPKLQLSDIDLDGLTVKLDQFKRDDLFNPTTNKRTDLILDPEINTSHKRFKSDDNVLKLEDNIENARTENFSRKKLIHILDDIKLDKFQSYNLVAKVKTGDLQDTNIIKAIATTSLDDDSHNRQDKQGEISNQEHIEEIDLTINLSAALVPPTQFLDEKCAEDVSIIPVATKTQDSLNIMYTQDNKAEEKTVNEAMESQNNVSMASDESFNNMKDIILKKHNLDLSPQFVYSKNEMLNVNHEERIVTSKFFEKSPSEKVQDKNNRQQPSQKETSSGDSVLPETDYVTTETKEIPKELLVHDNKPICSSPFPEANQNMESNKIEVPVSGFLFNHGPGDGIPESLDVSMSTTGLEECDADFPQCIDASLLLSPKADLTETYDNNVQVLSQDAPNFLSGLRKTGFSFFRSNSGNKSEEKNNGGNFNFTFGGGSEDKKNRGGLFSMFH